MATKAEKVQIIGEIYELLSLRTDQIEIFAKICQKRKMHERTFYRFLKEATAKLNEDIRASQLQVRASHSSAIDLRLRSVLWSQDEILFNLQNIAKETKRASDKINAMKLICDIQGYKAPDRSQIEIMQTPIFRDNPLLNGILDITPDQDLLE